MLRMENVEFIFWVVTFTGRVTDSWCFEGLYLYHFQGLLNTEDKGIIFLWNAGNQ